MRMQEIPTRKGGAESRERQTNAIVLIVPSVRPRLPLKQQAEIDHPYGA